MLKQLYKTMRKNMPHTWQGHLTKMVFKFSRKPYYKKDDIPPTKKFPRQAKGGMIISADFELAWAFRYSKEFSDPLEGALQRARRSRLNMPLLLRIFDKYNVPVTWATVGHLMLEECEPKTHQWMERIPHFENRCWKFGYGDWYDHDPYSNWQEAPEWYAPDLLKKIADSKVEHEIGLHTFSHIDFSDTFCPEKVAEDELKACRELTNGQAPLSMAFPAGTWGNRKALKKYGIKIYRRKIDFLNLAYPFQDEYGLYVTPTTMIFGRNYKNWSAKYYVSRFCKAIGKAIQTGTVAHFWFHPSMEPWTVKNVLPDVLQYATEKRKKSELWIGTMKDIYQHMQTEGL